MRRPLKRARAVAGLLALSLSGVFGWAVVLHAALGDDHGVGSSHHDEVGGLEMALHGHDHDEDTPAHAHSFVTSVAAPIPAKQIPLIPAMVGDEPEIVVTLGSCPRLLSWRGPTHDPPPRPEAVSVLRI